MNMHRRLVILAAAGAIALAVDAQQPKPPYKPPLGQRTVQGIWNGFEYVCEGDWLASLGLVKKPTGRNLNNPNDLDKPGDYSGESRPGYRAQPTPQSVEFYRYIMAKSGRGEDINVTESILIRRMIANRTWPEAPKMSDAQRGVLDWANRQGEGASISSPEAWTRQKHADIIYKAFTAAGLTEQDNPATEGSEKFRQYWNNLTAEEKKSLPLAGWMKQFMVNKGFDMRSDAERANDEAHAADIEKRQKDADAARTEADRQRDEAAKKDADRQKDWFKDRWADEDARIAAEEAKARLAEAVRKSKEEGAEPANTETPPGTGDPDGGMKNGDGQTGKPDGEATKADGPGDSKGGEPGGQSDGAKEDGTGGRNKPGPGDVVKGPEQKHGGTTRGGAGEADPTSPGARDAGGPSDPGMTGKEGGQGGSDVQNDAGQRVDPGRYKDGDMVVTKDGTEYGKKGDEWVKTGNNYGPYKPEGGLKNEPAAGAPTAKDGDSGGDRGAGLSGFTDSRNEKATANTRDSMGLMAGNQNISQASTRGGQAELDAKNALNNAGRDAQDTKDKSAVQVAAANSANSWGTAIGNGLQQGITKGVTAVGEAFGKGAAESASSSIFGGTKDDGKKPEAGKNGGNAGDSPAGTPGGAQVAGNSGGGSGGGHGDGHDGGSSKGGSKGTTKGTTKGPTKGGGAPGGGADGHDSAGVPPGSSPGATTGHGGSSQPPPPPPPTTYTITCPGCGRSFQVDTPGGHECPYCVTMSCPKCGHTQNYQRGSEPDSCPICAARAAAAAAAAAAAGGGAAGVGAAAGGTP